MYLWGTLDEGACYRDAIAPIREPDRAVTGFYCDFDGSSEYYDAAISPKDGRLLYRLNLRDEDDRVLAFVADGNGLGDYPASPHQNDLLVVTTPCGNNSDFFVDPDDGEVVYACHDSGERIYYRDGGERWELDQEYALLHLGFGETALVVDTGAWAIKTDEGEIIQPTMPLRLESTLPVRARPDGFWFANQVEDRIERWFLALDGTVTLEGEFPKPSPPTRTLFIPDGCALEASGALVCRAHSSEDLVDDRIIRAELGAPEAELVYSESESPLVKMHGSALVTGP